MVHVFNFLITSQECLGDWGFVGAVEGSQAITVRKVGGLAKI